MRFNPVKTADEISLLREGGKRLAAILDAVGTESRVGVSTAELENIGEKLIREGGDEPALLRFQPEGARRPYPATLCISVNNEVVHGIPNEHPRILKEGDILSIDTAMRHRGLVVDATIAVAVGKTDEKALQLLDTAKTALYAGIAAAVPGQRVGDIGAAIEAAVRPHRFGIVYECGGHAVGYSVHDGLSIPNGGRPGTGPLLLPGMVLAIEPIITEGSSSIRMMNDGYTVVTEDGKRAVHVEHTIVLTEEGNEILTEL